MGRKRSTYICPNCGEQGRRPRMKKKGKYGEYWYVEHYDPVTKKTNRTCYVEKFIRELKLTEKKQEISKSPFPDTIDSIYELNEQLEEFAKNMGIIAEMVPKYKIKPEDGKMMSLLLRKGARINSLILSLLMLNFELSTKPEENRTTSEQELLNKSNFFFAHLREITENYLNISNLREIRREIDFNDPKIRKIISENISGAREYLAHPIVQALGIFSEKYVMPERRARNALKRKNRNTTREQKKKLHQKLSNGAFGSNKYPSQYQGVSDG